MVYNPSVGYPYELGRSQSSVTAVELPRVEDYISNTVIHKSLKDAGYRVFNYTISGRITQVVYRRDKGCCERTGLFALGLLGSLLFCGCCYSSFVDKTCTPAIDGYNEIVRDYENPKAQKEQSESDSDGAAESSNPAKTADTEEYKSSSGESPRS